MKTMLLEDIKTWPPEVLSFLEQQHALFLNCAEGDSRVSPEQYDAAIGELRQLLRSDYAFHGYHCTRLTDDEIRVIIDEGMSLPNEGMLHARIDALLSSNEITSELAERLKGSNQAAERYRANMIWFCFFPPHLAGQGGIERFFRSWGGEALYNSHEEDPVSGPVLTRIGTPCIVEANVPIAGLAEHGGLDVKMIRRFLIAQGHRTRELADHEDRSVAPIPPQNIVRIICHPEPAFITLTKCNRWRPSL